MENSYQAQLPAPTSAKPLVSRIGVAAGVIGVLLIVGLIIWGIFWAATQHPTAVESLRDIVIIALALGSCLFGVAFIIMLVMIVRLVNMLEFEIKPILQQTNETIGTLKGTTTFVSQNVVKPVTKASSYVAGVRRGVKVLFGDPRNNLPD
ncbi:MAG: hypothetical protein KC418_07930 [Anaerolineales bacterium]|nr:hypothetical protein [Anaerolineales bacterium]MCB8954126.1 hypothetical protein [Ardenticatenales bacterium]